MDKNDDFEDKIDDNTDEFGLPNVNYEPLEEKKDQQRHEQAPPYTFPEDTENQSRGTFVAIVVIVIVLLTGALLGYFLYFKPNMEKEKQEEIAAKARAKKIKEKERLAKLKQEEEEARKKAMADSIANANASSQPNASTQRGNLSRLDQPRGRYHIVISSSVDDDLLVDYAKKLARRGVSTKIIPPHGKILFHRLTTAEDFETFQAAQQQAAQVNSNYEYGVWVLKY